MNQANLTTLMSKLRLTRRPHVFKLRTPSGPEGRLLSMRKIVTALIKHERIELNFPKAFTAREYAERLISEAIRNGDRHRTTMEMADHWLLEKQLVHKLFKVLAPRYQNFNISYTKMYKAPSPTSGNRYERSVLELRSNIFPPLVLTTNSTVNRNLIHNVLLEEARKEYQAKKAQQKKNELGSIEECAAEQHSNIDNNKAELA